VSQSKKLTFGIDGMGCEDCVAAIENAVMPLAGVAYVGVSLTRGTMTVRANRAIDLEDLCARVAALGYGIGTGAAAGEKTILPACGCRSR
jgi:copper chaperone CopZ